MPSIRPVTDEYVLPSFLHPLHCYLQSQELESQSLFASVGIKDPSVLRQHDKPVSGDRVERLFQLAETLAGEPDIGLKAGTYVRLTTIGLAASMIMSSGTTRQAFRMLSNHYKLIGIGAMTCDVSPEGAVIISLQREAELRPYSRHLCEYTIAVWTTVSRAILGFGHEPTRIEFGCTPGRSSPEQELFFGCPVSYHKRPDTRVYLPREYGDIELPSGDIQLQRILGALARTRIDVLDSQALSLDPFLAKINTSLERALVQGTPTVHQIALDFAMSARSLRYQLSIRNKTFSDILTQVRMRRATSLLGHRQASLTAIATDTGFAEQSAFQRAFKRWYGLTPVEYRKQILQIP